MLHTRTVIYTLHCGMSGLAHQHDHTIPGTFCVANGIVVLKCNGNRLIQTPRGHAEVSYYLVFFFSLLLFQTHKDKTNYMYIQ